MRMTLEQKSAEWAERIAERLNVPADKVEGLHATVAAAMADWHFEALLQHLESRGGE